MASPVSELRPQWFQFAWVWMLGAREPWSPGLQKRESRQLGGLRLNSIGRNKSVDR